MGGLSGGQKKRLALAQARLDKTQIRAPYDGVLGLRLVSAGDYLSAGDNIVNLEVLDPLKVDFRIPQKAVSQVRLGQAIELSLDAYPGERFRGEIIALNPRLDEVGRSQALRAQVANADQRLKPGQFVKVSVILAERPQALLIPLVAFDAAGYRLGYGGGFFDRTLDALHPRPLSIGVGFELNRVETIRPEPHDRRLDAIVTEAGIMHFG